VENFTRALDGLADWSKTHPGRLAKAVGSSQPFHLAYRPENILAPLSRYGDLICASIADPRQHRPVFADPAPGRPVRMVIISAHMRRHSVWDMILRGIVAHIDRQKFEIFLYHTQAPSDDETTWARTRAERFVQGPRSMRAWLDDIARDRPDVIFYPELGMDPVSCVLAAQRLAPLQIASWGHPVTTGLPTIDLFFSGELLEADDADSHYRERLVRLPGTGVCTESPELDAIPWSGPASRSDDIVRFALCQAPFKFDPADDVLLARIAKASGACQFWLASSERINWPIERLKQRLGNALRAEGLDPDAILRVIPRLPRRQFFSFLDQMDVYLDCPAFSGYTTAWQAIHRGLPIVTLEGPLMRQRLAAGLLRQIGVTEGIASTKEHYIGTAIAWGQESRRSDRWQARRLAIRQAAPKADGNQAAVRALEAAVIDALQGKRHDRPEPIPVGMSRG
jgi:predicted O-linked N-acetylglucosamine transferase (SPINDLY family)